MNPLLQEFLSEAREMLDAAAEQLLALERSPESSERMNELFRAIHTIKGSCGLFDCGPLATVTHASEDLLDTLRDGQLSVAPDIVDLLLNSFDRVRLWLDQMERGEPFGPGDEAEAKRLMAAFAAHLPHLPPPEPPAEQAPDWLAEVPDEQRLALFRAGPHVTLSAVRYVPDVQCFYAGDDPLYILRHLPGLAALHVVPAGPWPPLAEMDPYLCRLRFYAFSTAPVADVTANLKHVSGQVAVGEMPALWLAQPTGELRDAAPVREFCRQALAHLDRAEIAELERLTQEFAAEEQDPWTASALHWLQALLEAEDIMPAALRLLLRAMQAGARPDWATLAARTTPATDRAGLAPVLRHQLKVLTEHAAPDRGRIESAVRVLRNCLRHLGRNEPNLAQWRLAALDGDPQPLRQAVATVLEDLLGEPHEREKDTEQPVQETRMERTVRIDQARLDRLMDLVGELVVAKNSLPYIARRATAGAAASDIARDIKAHHATVNRIVTEMQEAVMRARMQRLSHVFQRFNRLVRDLAGRLGKKVELQMEGGDTEADKYVVDALADPLTHLVRNALDHGIEAPEERKAAGKAPEGLLAIRAWPENDRLQIEVSDDGRGIDPAKVKQRAQEKRVVAEERLAALSDREALQLVFAPGFSTAEEVSEVSGRGVGMDFVLTFAERLGGEAYVTSVPGSGTTVRLTLPTRLSLSTVMTFEAGGQRFGIPVDNVVETLHLEYGRVKTFKHNEAFVLRGRTLPLVRLHQLLQLDASPPSSSLPVLVADVAGEKIGLAVDYFGDTLEVLVKPMPDLLHSLTGYAGTALLGDGSVLLLLNLREVVQWRSA